MSPQTPNPRMSPLERFAAYRQGESDALDLMIERVRVMPGRSFSADAMEAAIGELARFIGARILARWDRTGEPPTAALVQIVVEAK